MLYEYLMHQIFVINIAHIRYRDTSFRKFTQLQYKIARLHAFGQNRAQGGAIAHRYRLRAKGAGPRTPMP